MKKQLKPVFAIGVYFSWWLIVFGTSFLAKHLFSKEGYMLGFYMGILGICYVLYLLLPAIMDRSNFKSYLEVIGFTLNKHSIALSILLVLTFTGSIIYTKTSMNSSILPGLVGLNYLIYMQPPLVEELLFRGIIPACFNNYPTYISGCISILLFASLHFRNGIQAILFSAVIGLILFVLRVQIKSLIPGILIHYIVNSGVTIALLPLLLLGFLWETYYFINRIKYAKRT